jgi:hypothetical protein
MGDATDFLVEDPEADELDRSYENRACDEICQLIDQEHAVVWHEIEARLAERSQNGINPHHLSNARRRLLEQGMIAQVTKITKGGRAITVYGLQDRRRRETAFDRSARRKRLLETRYLSWAGGSAETNAIGSAGELVTHASLVQARHEGAGYQILSEGREVRQLFGVNIPGGPIDNAAFLIGANATNPILVTVMIEVKNLRPWLYPSAGEIYQLLHKAAQVQRQQPNQHIMPVLIARQVHYLTRRMAKHLGFFTITFEKGVQPIRNLEFVDPRFVEEVRNELGYNLLLTNGEALPFVQRAFRYTVPKQAAETANRWALMGPALEHHFARLRNSSVRGEPRETALNSLYRDAVQIIRPARPWRRAQ